MSPCLHCALAGERSHSLRPMKKNLKVERMTRSNLFCVHNKQTVRRKWKEKERANGRKKERVSRFELLVLYWAVCWYHSCLLWWGHLRSPWGIISIWESARDMLQGKRRFLLLIVVLQYMGLDYIAAVLYNVVILKLCACLLFPYQQQLEKMAKWDRRREKEDRGESQH